MTAPQISRAQATELEGNPGYYLLAEAAKAWDSAIAAYGKQVLLSGAWRSYETQEALFRDRYRKGRHAGRPGYTTDVRYWAGSYWTRLAGTAPAAIPGTSNHGGGIAVDVKTARAKGDPAYPVAVIFTGWDDPDRVEFLKVAEDYGWADDEGESVNEVWHLTYYSARNKHKNDKARAILQKGTKKADDVETLQAFLNTVVDPDIDVDGVYGDDTVTAVERYQRKVGVTPTGKVGVVTRARLIQSGIDW